MEQLAWRYIDTRKKCDCLDKIILWYHFAPIPTSVCIMEPRDIDKLGANVQKSERKANEILKTANT